MKHLAMIISLLGLASCSQLSGQPAVERRIDSLLSLMTMDEKVGQLVQYNYGSADWLPFIRAGKVGSFLNVT
ncbi:MAG TPA: hypothetical protein VMM37_10065, partial [Bacteroidota bacterium]|nr:hypothetical protein [Bacteroidota bacterium]